MPNRNSAGANLGALAPGGWTSVSARDVKVVPLHLGMNSTARARNAEAGSLSDMHADNGAPGTEPDDLSPADETGKPVKIRIRHRKRTKRLSPAAVLARSLDGGVEHRADLAGDGGSAEAVFWRVWLEHRNYLRMHSLRFSGGNMADAEDALSEAMLKAAQSFSPAKIRNHRSWLLRLVHNACMDRHRSNRRRQRVAKDIMDADPHTVPAVAVQPDRSPEELLAAFEQVDDLRRALAALPAFLAEPLLLYLDERSDSEIALNLNVTKEVVRKRRQIARSLLRQQIFP